ncbi:MAG TPA: hypothetical protein VLV84_03040 [Candidatus Acidoferrales bacterium]|nr:hypothetical protein [Candidatus Acidoferrales bacterium]
MQLSNVNQKILSIALILVLSISAALAIVPSTKARDIQGTIATYAYLQAVPQQVGIGQNVFLVMWVDKPPTTAFGPLGDRWVGLSVTITQPDGKQVVLGPFQSDDAGGYTATFTPTELGNYTAVFSFPGETLTGDQGNPGGMTFANTQAIGDVFGASTSAAETISVTQTPASTISENPLPTSYWTNPVEAFNHNWYVIDGNWFGLGDVEFANTGDYAVTGNYNPYTTAPTSAHILWTTPLVPGSPGGQMGGEFGASEQGNYYSGFQYQPKFSPIIINGVLYYDAVPTYSSGGAYQGWVARDLRSGQILWTKNYRNYFATGSYDLLMCGQVYVYKSPNTYGGQSYLWATRTTNGINYMDLFDAATGNYILSINGSGPTGSFGVTNIEGSNGILLQYYTSTNATGTEFLNFWNSSVCLIGGGVDLGFSTLNQNSVTPYSKGVVWSVPLPNSYQGTAFPPGVSWILDEVGHAVIDPDNNIAILGAGAGEYAMYSFATGWVMRAAYNLNNGALLWIKNQTETPYSTVMAIPGANDGVYVEYTKETTTFSGYSTTTGQQVWGPTTPFQNPLGYYDQTSGVCAGGALYAWTFGGWIYKYNITNGDLIWSYTDGTAGENTPYGVNPFWIIGDYEATLAGGMLFAESGHCYGPPLFSGAKLYAINATTGKLVWSIINFDTGSCPAVVDGQLLTFNAYDNQIYSYGVGPTKTTVSAPSVGVSTTTPITISGMVTDISSGSQQQAVAANFPNGLPCVSDASMEQFMEAVYEQEPMPTNITGVPVTVYVLDSNNNYRSIGTTTTDASGFYSLNWTPDIKGNYTVTATFAGSPAYYASSAQTAFYASAPAPTQAPTSTPLSGLATQNTLEYIGVAIIIVIIIIGAVIALLVTRKRP